jgi:fructose-bisphosphate aldolase class II
MLTAYDNGLMIPGLNVPHLQMVKPLVCALRDTESFGLIEVARLEWEKFHSKSLEAVYETYQSYKDERYTRLHLDHVPVIDEDGRQVDYLSIIRRAIELGYDSVMVDGSRLKLTENIQATRSVVEMAHAKEIPVEAELGAVVGHEEGPMPSYDELFSSGKGFTHLDEAIQFVRETQVDWLSIAFGNVHGAISQARRSEAKIPARLNIDHLKTIRQAVNIPLVLHGGSNIPSAAIQEAIRNGITKINIGTELRQAYEANLAKSVEAAQEAVYTQACRIFRDTLRIAGKANQITSVLTH